MENKIKIYRGATIFELKNISEDTNFTFSEDINSGQGGFDIYLNTDYFDETMQVNDMFEYSIYNEDYKNGLLKYTGIVRKIVRTYKKGVEGIKLECESLSNLFVQVEVDKTYTGTYQSIVNDIIADLPTNICNMDFLGTTIFKNQIQNTNIAPDLVVNGTLLKALQNLFEDLVFFINQNGEIKDTFTKKHYLNFSKEIIESELIENETGFIKSEIIIGKDILDINVGDLIKIQNTDTFLNLDNKQIKKLDFELYEKTIFIGKIEQLVAN